MTLIDRYLVGSLIGPFLLGVAGMLVITLINTLFNLAALIAGSGVAPSTAALMLFYTIPANMVVTLPVAFIFAALLVIGRMGKDGEIVALRAAGMSFKRLLAPIFGLSLLVTGLAFVIMDEVVPRFNQKFVDLHYALILKQGKPVFRHNVFFKDPEGRRYFFVNRVDRLTYAMEGVYVHSQDNGARHVITAEEATWKDGAWELKNGVSSSYDTWGAVQEEEPFRTLILKFDADPRAFFASGERSAREKGSAELREEIETLRLGGNPVTDLEVEYQVKFALPFSTFFATLIAAPLGAIFSRLGGFAGVAITIVLVMVYQVLMGIFQALGINGVVDPITGAWAQNYLFGAIGAFLLWKVDR